MSDKISKPEKMSKKQTKKADKRMK